MGLFDFFKRNKNNTNAQKHNIYDDAELESAKRVVKNESENWQKMYDYDTTSLEVFKAISSDSTLRQIVARYIEVTLRQGFTIKSDDEEINKKLHKRLLEIEIASGSKLYMILRKMMHDLIAYGNAFLTLKRNAANSSGKPYVFIDGSKLEPVSAVFHVDPYNMMVSRNKHGRIVGYRQDINMNDWKYDYTWYADPDREIIPLGTGGKRSSGVVTFDPNDVVHVKYDESNLAFGRSFLLEAIEDLLILRRIESVITRMIDEGEFYVKIYTVGTKESPGTKKQTMAAKEIIEDSVPEEFLLIPGNHDIDFKEMSSLKDLKEYAEYFKRRYYGALGVSPVSMGEPGAANRATADSSNEGMYDKARDFQMILSSVLESTLMTHIVMDLGYSPEDLDEHSMPKVVFPDPDVDKAIKLENEATHLYEHFAITREEMRRKLGMEPIADDDKGTYLHQVKIPIIEAEARAKAKAAMESGSADTDNRVQPQNQHSNGGNE